MFILSGPVDLLFLDCLIADVVWVVVMCMCWCGRL